MKFEQVIPCAELWWKSDSNFEFIEGYGKGLIPFPIDKWYSKSWFGSILNRTVALRELVVKSSKTGKSVGFLHGYMENGGGRLKCKT